MNWTAPNGTSCGRTGTTRTQEVGVLTLIDGRQAMDWYIANLDDLDRGDEILPLRGPIYVANSHKLAVACWRYWELVHPRRRLTYYRVQPVSYEGELRPVDEIPGLFECETI